MILSSPTFNTYIFSPFFFVLNLFPFQLYDVLPTVFFHIVIRFALMLLEKCKHAKYDNSALEIQLRIYFIPCYFVIHLILHE